MGAKPVALITIPSDPAILAYIAGIVDGEGCIRITSCFHPTNSVNSSHSLRLAITNTSAGLIAWLLRVIGGSVTKHPIRHDKRPGWHSRKPVFDWYVHGNNAALLVMGLQPYLIIKREQADLVGEFIALNKRHKTTIRGHRRLSPRLVHQREAIERQLVLAKRA